MWKKKVIRAKTASLAQMEGGKEGGQGNPPWAKAQLMKQQAAARKLGRLESVRWPRREEAGCYWSWASREGGS